MSPWLRSFNPRPGTSVRLVCFPHAGGGPSSFRPWDALLPDSVELLAACYPGREDRFAEPAAPGLAEMGQDLAEALLPLLDRPWIAFGHSMGTIVAYETVRQLQHLGAPVPLSLHVSGRRSPDRGLGGTVHSAGEEGLKAELERLGGTPKEVLEDEMLRSAILGTVREDYRLVETYRPVADARVGCPVRVLGGRQDPELNGPSEDGAFGWSRFTTAAVTTRMLPGDHFYLVPHRREVVADVLSVLDPALVGASRTWPDTP
ncbi:thioesterase domain-containing protein [Kineosporia sp. NBRC 101731]|uniref:thioesterase II family protein n=1 Tax=Kineosporia sp. NBRC 101731 TaxID=3032199 RepID=UPI0024A2319E|nr:thioesterase domain-containing protein [Kineosporia sp. NBRC 101731]GLY32366.1 thioesterase [Kineosporia sp. NBRC 101731]